MGVVSTRKKRITQNKKRPNKKVTLTCAHKWKDDNQISHKGALTKEQKKMKSIKEIQILLVHNYIWLDVHN